MSLAPAAAQAPVSVSLFDLSTDAPVLQGLRLVSHFPEEALAQALQTSCPGIWEGVGWTRKRNDRTLWSLLCSPPGNTFLLVFPSLGALVDISFHWIKFISSQLQSVCFLLLR